MTYLMPVIAPAVGFLGEAVIIFGLIILGVNIGQGLRSPGALSGMALMAAGGVVAAFAALYGG